MLRLYNNLDLLVAKVGKNFLGNSIANQTWDILNNVERVDIPFTAATTQSGTLFSVIVYGANVASGSQAYSLVVSGNFQKVVNGQCNVIGAVCPGKCNVAQQWGTCNAQSGRCTCSLGHAGSACAQENPLLIANPPGSLTFRQTGTVTASAYQYFRIPVPTGSFTSGMKVTTATSPRNIAVDLFFAKTYVPDRVNFDRVLYSGLVSPWGGTLASSWLPSAGSSVFVAVSGYCCDESSFSMNITFS
jgi:hypothetical protein